MKQAFRKQKHNKPHTQPTASARAKTPAVRKGPNWALLAVVGVFTALITFVLCEYVLLSKVPVDMLGPWVVVKSDPDINSVGDTMEFHRDGSVHLKFASGEEVRGKVKMVDDRLVVLIANPANRSLPPIEMSFLVISTSDSHMELERDRLDPVSGTLLYLERPSQSNARKSQTPGS